MTDDPVELLLTNGRLLDPEQGAYAADQNILIRGDRIAEVGGGEVRSSRARVIDLGGRTVMPGLVDCHVHVKAITADLGGLASMAPSYVAIRATEVMRSMLLRGFTTVRDVGGADYGLAQAVDEGRVVGPRLLFGGKALSQSGGHGDERGPGQSARDEAYWTAGLNRVCDGVTEARRAARDELRRGAHHIKIMLSGGVASPTDRVDSTQFSLDEIRAIVEEATAAGRYVAGHAYTSAAVNRGLECGVRSIEHANLMDESSIPLFKAHQAFYVPTLVTYSALAEHGREYGLPEVSQRKVADVLDSGLHALELAHRSGLPIVYGTDLLGGMHAFQLREVTIRSQVQPLADIIRSATVTAARLLRLEGQVGVIAPGAFADVLVLDGDPLRSTDVLTDPDTHLRLIVKAGQVAKSTLPD